jgi:hypothetical protein
MPDPQLPKFLAFLLTYTNDQVLPNRSIRLLESTHAAGIVSGAYAIGGITYVRAVVPLRIKMIE